MRIEDNALLLRRTPFRDASWIVALLTPNHGTVSAAAKGVRSSRGGERAALNGFHTLNIEVRSRGPESMGTLSRVEIVRARNHLAFMPVAAGAALLLGEAVYRYVLPGDVQQAQTHALLEQALDALDQGMDPLAVVGGTFGHLLWLFGYGWRVNGCVGCGGREALQYFSIRRGATVCLKCGTPYGERLLVLNENLRQAMAQATWPPELRLLSPEDLSMLYQIGMARLVLTGGRTLSGDGSFRRLAGVRSVTGGL